MVSFFWLCKIYSCVTLNVLMHALNARQSCCAPEEHCPRKLVACVGSLTLFRLAYADVPSGCELLGWMALVIQQPHPLDLSVFRTKRKNLCHICCQRSSASQHAHVHRSSWVEREKLRRSLDLWVAVLAMYSNCRSHEQHSWVMNLLPFIFQQESLYVCECWI